MATAAPVREKPLTISGIAAEIEARIGVKPTLAKNVLKALADIAESELNAGRDFRLPDVATIRLAYVPRKPKREVRNPLTGETRMADPKPASIAVRARVNPRMKRAAPSPGTKGGKVIADIYKAKH